MCRTVIRDHRGVVDRDVGGLAVEVVHRVATLTHHLRDEQIGFPHRARRMIDERGLDGPPPVGEAV